MAFETLGFSPFNRLTRMIARQNFITLSHRESTRSYILVLIRHRYDDSEQVKSDCMISSFSRWPCGCYLFDTDDEAQVNQPDRFIFCRGVLRDVTYCDCHWFPYFGWKPKQS